MVAVQYICVVLYVHDGLPVPISSLESFLPVMVTKNRNTEARCGTGEVSPVEGARVMSGVSIIAVGHDTSPIQFIRRSSAGVMARGVRLVCRVRVRAAGVFLRGLVLGGGDDAALISPD